MSNPNNFKKIQTVSNRQFYRQIQHETESQLIEIYDRDDKLSERSDILTEDEARPGTSFENPVYSIQDEPFCSPSYEERRSSSLDCLIEESSNLQCDINKISPQEDISKNNKSYVWSLSHFQVELKEWAIKEQVKQSAVTSILKIIKKHDDFSSLPSDARALLKTPRVTEINKICGGSYVYLGLKVGLLSILMKEKELPTSLKLLIGVDGLPISHSSGSQLWPQLGKVKSIPNSPVFVIGLFHGSHKPNDSNAFMIQLINELKLLVENGILINNFIINIDQVAFVCDAPAKAFILKIKGHTGFFSCTRCDVEGDYVNGRVCFPVNPGRLRSSDGFVRKVQEEHHLGDTLLIDIPKFNVIANVPLDYMHLVCLGVVRKVLNLWIKGSLNYRIPSKSVKQLSKILLSLKNHIPSEFARKPRGLDELGRWKATELRQFLLYTGPVVLIESACVSQSKVSHFLTLSVAMRILLNDSTCYELQSYAKSLLEHFVKLFKDLYGEYNISHNVHGLLHIADDVDNFGPLDTCSAFQFENHMQSLKKRIRKHNQPLQQLARRISEESNVCLNERHVNPTQKETFEHCHDSGPLVQGCTAPQYKKINLKNFQLCCNRKDSFCSLTSGIIVKIVNIAFDPNASSMAVIGEEYQKTENLFEKPCKSSKLNICLIKRSKNPLQVWPIDEIKSKLVALPFKKQFVVFPLIHLS